MVIYTYVTNNKETHMTSITLAMNVNTDELRNIRNTLTELLGTGKLNDAQAEAMEGLLTLTDLIIDKVDSVQSDTVCPHCGNDEPDWGSIEVDGDTANQEGHCPECGCVWFNEYAFKGLVISREGGRSE